MPGFAVLKYKITIIFNEKLVEIHKGSFDYYHVQCKIKSKNSLIKIQEIPNWVQKPYFTKFHPSSIFFFNILKFKLKKMDI